MKDFCSIIMTHYNLNEMRSELFRACIVSLMDNTRYPYEFILVDNGCDDVNQEFIIKLVQKGKIHTYIKNARNMHFPYARNQGLRIAKGRYICIVDDDLIFSEGWLEKCVKVLETTPEKKYWATPMKYPNIDRYVVGSIEVEGEPHNIDMRAGSNCYVMRRGDFVDVGEFPYHRNGGGQWINRAVDKGYRACVLPGNIVEDMARNQGYEKGVGIPMYQVLSDGTKLYFNSDEYAKVNPDKEYYDNSQPNFS